MSRHQGNLKRETKSLLIAVQKKRTLKIVDFALLADHRVKLKESENKNKYLDLAREWKKLWNMKVTLIPIMIGALGTVTKGLIKGLGNERTSENHPNTASMRLVRILRRVLET